MYNNDFNLLDDILMKQKNKIIHQVWFGIIPNKIKAKQTFKKFKIFKDSWIKHNPDWFYYCWDLNTCKNLIKLFYPQHLELYEKYPYHIQRCDVIRYFILHRYGGLYADMDYYCNKSWNDVLIKYPNSIYLVETPNKIYSDIHISNSLMYSKSGHVFWNKIFIELEINKNVPIYYSRHMTIMFTTGPGLLNRIFNKYKYTYMLNYYPYKLFHPYGLLTTDLKTINVGQDIFAVHLGKGSWETQDSKIIIFLFQEYKILLLIIIILLIPIIIYFLFGHKKKVINLN